MTHTHLVPRLKPSFTGPARGRRGDTCLEVHKKPHTAAGKLRPWKLLSNRGSSVASSV